eukprot:TRINITY_DN13800_c0_g1_i4.p2 TRINITY_DN13800_c0_g1~~TRINITY_DN13800_c0_g1_i4.p2  ORF type:complete len:115 (-),score=21.00 TRINITY_DN13800_c0_g1_i4:97-441(-)
MPSLQLTWARLSSRFLVKASLILAVVQAATHDCLKKLRNGFCLSHFDAMAVECPDMCDDTSTESPLRHRASFARVLGAAEGAGRVAASRPRAAAAKPEIWTRSGETWLLPASSV